MPHDGGPSNHPDPTSNRVAFHTALRNAAQWAKSQANAAIIIGDLNATPWSVNSQLGRGPGMTWPAGAFGDTPLTMIPIDHCLHTADLETIARQTGPSLGSDHRALRVTLAVKGQGQPPDRE